MIIIYIFYVTTKGQDLKSLVPFLIFLSLISIRLVPVIVNINVILTSLKYVEGPVKEYIDKRDFIEINHTIVVTSATLKPHPKSIDEIRCGNFWVPVLIRLPVVLDF
jgi:hypothetical protein